MCLRGSLISSRGPGRGRANAHAPSVSKGDFVGHANSSINRLRGDSPFANACQDFDGIGIGTNVETESPGKNAQVSPSIPHRHRYAPNAANSRESPRLCSWLTELDISGDDDSPRDQRQCVAPFGNVEHSAHVGGGGGGGGGSAHKPQVSWSDPGGLQRAYARNRRGENAPDGSPSTAGTSAVHTASRTPFAPISAGTISHAVAGATGREVVTPERP